MNFSEQTSHPHRRFNPLTREWVLVSPHRTQRPWQGQVEDVSPEAPATYDPNCYLCPGNARARGLRKPAYTETFVLDNDFAALKPDTPAGEIQERELLVARSEAGRCRVVCFSPRHDFTMARMSVPELRHVVDTWARESRSDDGMQQSSSPRAHLGQRNLYPMNWRRNWPFGDYRQLHGTTLLHDYLELELGKQERLVCANDHFVLLVPFWRSGPLRRCSSAGDACRLSMN